MNKERIVGFSERNSCGHFNMEQDLVDLRKRLVSVSVTLVSTSTRYRPESRGIK